MLVLIPFICVTIYRFLPVSYDAGACGGGFNTYIYNKNIDNLIEIYAGNNNIDSEISATNNFSVKYHGRNIYITAVITYSEENEPIEKEVKFKGKRIWTEKYIWEEIKSEL